MEVEKKYTNLILPAQQKKIESLENEELCKDFLEELKKAKFVDTFCLMGNSYSDKFFEELSKYLENVQEIRKVILNDIFTSRKEDLLISLDHLNKSLQNKKIILFDLSNNAICPNGCLRIKNIFMTNKTMKHLFLNHSALSQAGTVTISEYLKESELDLVQFEATKNRIEIQIDQLSPVLATMKSLETVVLFQNNIKEEQMTNLVKNLSKCQNLKNLDLSDNYLPSQSIEELKGLLKNNKNLKVLKISDCNITEEDSENFLNFVSNEDLGLEFLGYNYNEIQSLKDCADSLQKLKNLKKLEIKGIFEDDEQQDQIKEQLDQVDILFESDYDEDDDEDLQCQENTKMNKLIQEFKDMEFQLNIFYQLQNMENQQARENYIQKYKEQRASYKTPFNSQEQKASDKLNILLQDLLKDFNIYKNFFENRKILKQSKLFTELKKMPKGVIHHLHNPACADLTVIETILKDKRSFMNPDTNVIKLIQTDKDEEEGFIRIEKLQEEIGQAKVLEKMKKKIIFDEEKFYDKTNQKVFDNFITAFESLDIVFNEKYYELQIEKTFEILNEDNIQAVELRNMFGFMKQDNDLSIMPFEKELDFQKKIFEKISNKYDIKYALYQTGLKNIGKEHIKVSLDQYISSMKSHPGFIRGYDMCHWEDYLYISDVYQQLEDAKLKHDVHYCFHAGESLNPCNNNVIDAMTLGSKRLGHGVQVVNSSYLIDLVKSKDISVELNPLSNYLLGYVRDLNQHPGKILMQSGVSVTINPDDYAIFEERGVTLDYILSMIYLKFDLKDFKCCLQNSINYSIFNNKEKKQIQKKFDESWSQFITNLIN